MDSEAWQSKFTQYLLAEGRSEHTVASYLVEVRYFLKFLGERGLPSVHDIIRKDVEAYQVSLEHRLSARGRPLAAGTKNGKLTTVRAFLKYLRKTGVLLTDPGRDIVRARLPRRLLPDLPTEDEVQQLLETPDTSTSLGLRDRAILELLYASALRNTELRLLRVGDVDLARLQVRVKRGKGGGQRIVPTSEDAAFWVQQYLERGRAFLLRDKEHGFLFMSFRGRPFQVNRLGELVTRLAAKAGLDKHVTPHTLRHCAATHMLKNRARLRHLQEFLGHASPESTQIYTRVELSDLREAHLKYHPSSCGRQVGPCRRRDGSSS